MVILVGAKSAATECAHIVQEEKVCLPKVQFRDLYQQYLRLDVILSFIELFHIESTKVKKNDDQELSSHLVFYRIF